MKSILFVCVGNVQRSVIAERVLQDIFVRENICSFKVFSRGLQGSGGRAPTLYKRLQDYPDQWEASRYVLEELKISLENHEAKPISRQDVEQASVIIAMQDVVLETEEACLAAQFPEFRSKMHSFGELDGTSGAVECGEISVRESHEQMIRDLVQTLERFYPKILSWTDSQ